ncbi:conserved hypothetical protein [Gammaproteobacteria bacterium]
MVGVLNDAVHGTNLNALGLVKVTYAFRTQVGVDDVGLIALRNGAVRALGLANITIDAFIGNNQGHCLTPYK